MSSVADGPEPTTITVMRRGDEWVACIFNADTTLHSETLLAWDGTGGFFQDGLDALARSRAIPEGYAYSGNAWDENADGSRSAVLHQEDPRFRRD